MACYKPKVCQYSRIVNLVGVGLCVNAHDWFMWLGKCMGPIDVPIMLHIEMKWSLGFIIDSCHSCKPRVPV